MDSGATYHVTSCSENVSHLKESNVKKKSK
jgi:hypothetical protein